MIRFLSRLKLLSINACKTFEKYAMKPKKSLEDEGAVSYNACLSPTNGEWAHREVCAYVRNFYGKVKESKVKNILLVVAVVMALSATLVSASETKLNLETEIDKLSYVMGQNLGKSLKMDEVEVNIDVLFQSIRDAYEGKESIVNEEETKKILMDFQNNIRTKRMAKMQKEAGESKVEGEKFLEENKAKEGVVVTESGLQYKVLKEGSGESPKAGDKVKVKYKGTFIDGKVFDSNESYEVTVGRGVITGWSEVLQLMKPGSKCEVYIPSALAYGERGNRGISPNKTLIFEMELLEIVVTTSDAPKTPGAIVPQ